MVLTKPQKILLLLLAVIPPIVLIIINLFHRSNTPEEYSPWEAFSSFAISVITLIFYFRHLIKDPYLSSNSKTIWGIFFILLSTITMVIYWFRHIWPGPEPDME